MSPTKESVNRSSFWRRHQLWFMFLFAFTLRAWNIGSDLPQLYYQDEPHHLHVAAYFSTGDLNPHDFKYPTLWPYLLAGLLAFLFIFAKLVGLVHSAQDFASAFFQSPTVFYLSARLLSAGLFAGGSAVLTSIGRKYYDQTVAIAAGLLLALSPSMFPFGRDATLNSVMVFFICCALHASHGMIKRGERSDAALTGLFVGLSASSHYIAAPIAILPVLFHVLKPADERRNSDLFLCLGMMGVGFLIGTPFFLLDYRKALSDLVGMGKLHVSTLGQFETNELALRHQEITEQMVGAFENLVKFLDPHGIGFGAALAGVFFCKSRRERLHTLAWFAPALVMIALLAKSYHGTFYRYSLGVYIPLLIPAAVGFSHLSSGFGGKTKRILVASAVFIPLSWSTFVSARAMGLPDTRNLAYDWVMTHVRQNEKIFLMFPYYCPQLPMNQVQLNRLLAKTKALHHPREKFFQALLHNHTGGGYELFYWRRNLTEVEDLPNRTERSYEAQDTIDMNKEGVNGLIKENIHIALINEAHGDLVPPAWIQEVTTRYHRTASFYPEEKKWKGPKIDIYTSDDGRPSQ